MQKERTIGELDVDRFICLGGANFRLTSIFAIISQSGRKCIVVGASYGIGRSTADILAARGAHVVYASRSHDKLSDAIKGKENCHAVVMDASDRESIANGMVEAISKLQGELDLVVYCPGERANVHFYLAVFHIIFDTNPTCINDILQRILWAKFVRIV